MYRGSDDWHLGRGPIGSGAGFDVSCDFAGLRSGRRGLTSNPDQAGKIVGEIGEADLGPGASHAYGANDQAKPAFLSDKDVLDAGANPGAGSIAAGDMGRHLH